MSYFPNTSGKYSMSISLNGIALPSSPFELKVMAARPDPASCVLKGDALNAATAREPAAFEVSFIDSLGQHTHAEDLDVFVELLAKVDDGLDPLEITLPGDDSPHLLQTDAYSANTELGQSYWSGFHTYRLEWNPHPRSGFLRWSLDGHVQFQLDAAFLFTVGGRYRAQATDTVNAASMGAPSMGC